MVASVCACVFVCVLDPRKQRKHASAPLQRHCEWQFFAFIFNCSFCIDNFQALALRCACMCMYVCLCVCIAICAHITVQVYCKLAVAMLHFSTRRRAVCFLQGINVNKCLHCGPIPLATPTTSLGTLDFSAAGLIVSTLRACWQSTGSQFKLGTSSNCCPKI